MRNIILRLKKLKKWKWNKVTDREKELLIEIEKLKEQIEEYRIIEVELSTQIDLLREGIIK